MFNYAYLALANEFFSREFPSDNFEMFKVGDMLRAEDTPDLVIRAGLSVDERFYYGWSKISERTMLLGRSDFHRSIEEALAEAKKQCWQAYDIESHATALAPMLGEDEP